MNTIELNGKKIGDNYPVFLIAEISSNHQRDKSVVKRLIDIAADAGFDAVKFQTYDPPEVFSGEIRTTDVKLDSLYGDITWWQAAKDFVLMPREWFREMFDYAKHKGLIVFATGHSINDIDFLDQFGQSFYKVASIDVSYLDFLRELANRNKPIIMSTGMHDLGEIEAAVNTILNEGNKDLVLLHCVSNYPPLPDQVNLRNIEMLKKSFELPVGFSNHHPDNYMDVAAVALGASIIEKHITLDRRTKGPDHPFALDPKGMAELVRLVRETERSLGTYKKVLSKNEKESRNMARRSVVAKTDIKKGDILRDENIKLTRPGNGIHPKNINMVLNKRAKKDIKAETLLCWEDIY